MLFFFLRASDIRWSRRGQTSDIPQYPTERLLNHYLSNPMWAFRSKPCPALTSLDTCESLWDVLTDSLTASPKLPIKGDSVVSNTASGGTPGIEGAVVGPMLRLLGLRLFQMSRFQVHIPCKELKLLIFQVQPKGRDTALLKALGTKALQISQDVR